MKTWFLNLLYKFNLYRYTSELMEAAMSKGAHGAFLSGAGPTVLALTGGHGSDVHADTMVTFLAVEVADAMMDAAKANDCAGRVVISSPSIVGVTCHKEKNEAEEYPSGHKRF